MIKKYIIIKTQFPAVHYWKDCNIDEVSYLKHPHRHLFHVHLKATVDHGDRAIEFISFKQQINAYIDEHFANKKFECSCEMIAEQLLKAFSKLTSVEVYEDNENGGGVEIV